MLFIRPGRTLRDVTTVKLATLVTDLALFFTSVTKTSFFFQSHAQIPQGDFGTIPATCLFKDCSQATVDCFFCNLDLCRYFCIRASLKNKRCDGPFSTRKIHVSIQQRHCVHPHFNRNLAMWVTVAQSFISDNLVA